METIEVNLKNGEQCSLTRINLADDRQQNQQIRQIIAIQNANHPHSTKLTTADLDAGKLFGESSTGFWEHSWVATLNGEIVGYALNCEQQSEYFQPVKVPGPSFYLYIVDVEKTHQNLGLGTLLIQRSIAAFRIGGFFDGIARELIVTIQTRKDNEPMRHVIEKKMEGILLGERYYSPTKTDNVYIIP